MSQSHQNLINIWPGQGASLEQIGEAVKHLRVTCELSAILDFAEKRKTIIQTNFSGTLIVIGIGWNFTMDDRLELVGTTER